MEEFNQMQYFFVLLEEQLQKKLIESCFTAEKFTFTETRHRGTSFNCITFQEEEYII